LPFPSDPANFVTVTKAADTGLAGEPQEPLQQQPAAWPYPSTTRSPAVDPRAALVAFQRPQMPAPVSKSMVFAKLLRETDGGDRPSGLDRLRQRHRGAS
jgi:hypothetical protein